MKHYIVGFIDIFGDSVYEYEYYKTKLEAISRRRFLQDYGYTKVFIKKKER